MGLRNAQGLNHDLYIDTLVGGLRHPLFYMYINAESLTLCLYSWLSMDFAAIVDHYHLLSETKLYPSPTIISTLSSSNIILL